MIPGDNNIGFRVSGRESRAVWLAVEANLRP